MWGKGGRAGGGEGGGVEGGWDEGGSHKWQGCMLCIHAMAHRRASQSSRLRPARLLGDGIVVVLAAVGRGVLSPVRLGLGRRRSWGDCW